MLTLELHVQHGPGSTGSLRHYLTPGYGGNRYRFTLLGNGSLNTEQFTRLLSTRRSCGLTNDMKTKDECGSDSESPSRSLA